MPIEIPVRVFGRDGGEFRVELETDNRDRVIEVRGINTSSRPAHVRVRWAAEDFSVSVPGGETLTYSVPGNRRITLAELSDTDSLRIEAGIA